VAMFRVSECRLHEGIKGYASAKGVSVLVVAATDV
jgi:hypothetical protein